MATFSKKVPLWPVALIIIVCLAIIGLLAMKSAGLNILGFSTNSESRNTQIVNSITREEQVVLLSLGVQGIKEETEAKRFLNLNIPGSDRASSIQYSFNGKLGIDGREVQIRQEGEDKFLVSIPEFMFIGHDAAKFELIVEDNGALSFITPKIDEVEMVNQILNDDAKDQYIQDHEAILKEQAEDFYKGIITGVDPDVEVKFEFAS